MQSDEQRKARMRAYYRKNRDKWRKYKEDGVARLSNEQLAERKDKQREYHRRYYQKHRTKIVNRTKRYRKLHSNAIALYQAMHFQKNKAAIAARRKKRYHEVVRPRNLTAKQNSEFVSIREAAEILGATKLRTFREWVYRGRIESVRTPGGRYLLRRKSIEEIVENIEHLPVQIRKQLGIYATEEEQ